MSNIKRMKDKDGNYIYPVTHASAVFDKNDKSIDAKLQELEANDKSIDAKLQAIANGNGPNIVASSMYKNFLDYSDLVEEDDWTAAFNKMAEEIGVEYNALYIPNGQYNIKTRIIFEEKQDIVIVSDFAEIKNTVQDNANSTGGTFYFRNSENIHIEGIKHRGIDSTFPVQTIDYGHHGMLFHGCKNITILRNHFYDFADNALLLAQESNQDTENVKHGKNVWVKDCYFRNIWQTSTTTMGANNVYYVNNIIDTIGGSCKFAQRYDLGGNLFVIGNRITGVKRADTTSTAYTHGFEINNYRNIIIKDNIVDQVGGSGIFINNNNNSQDAERYIFTGEITIANNKFLNFETAGIYIANPTVTIGNTAITELMRNIYIRNNSFLNEVKSINATIHCTGNQLAEVFIENNFVDNPGCTFINYNCKAIQNEDSTYKYPNSRFYIKGNTVVNSLTGINILQYLGGLIIEGNNIECTTYGISSSIYSEDIVIRNNVIRMLGTAGNCINAQGEFNRAIIEGNLFESNQLGMNLTLTEDHWMKIANNSFINPNAVGIRLANQAGIIYHFGNTFTNESKKISNTGTTVITSITEITL